ncbi:MAG: hypothetical protein DRO07_01160 [Candidatus Iainarchaeum archaeon]|uniref:Uncharacterized protein n=1 Tax=Candidatus Iainarchaeum sp. TaxID=3101447 RepID=A0A497JH34_9ARCH|nr:MAG: hypothetical protein DRO07_01160 [Candidatus Diapherotrites archaeon]
MPRARLVERCLQRLSYLQVKIRDINWAELSRHGFVKEASNALQDLLEVESTLKELKKETKEIKSREFDELLGEYKRTLSLLQKNIEFEEKKEPKGRLIHELEAEENPELFASLQQKVLSLLLRTRFFIERLNILLSKEKARLLEKGEEQEQLLELLHQKEKELQELKQKYNEVRKSVFFGMEEASAADLEEELTKARLALEREKKKLEDMFADYRAKIASLQADFMSLADRLEELQRYFDSFCEKSSELTLLLKKERDFAKKLVLDMEAEVLELRNTYSRELLNLEEAKLEARKDAERELMQRIRKLEDELLAKEELLKHFRDLAKSKDSEARELEERIAFLNAAMRAHEAEHVKRKAEKTRKAKNMTAKKKRKR